MASDFFVQVVRGNIPRHSAINKFGKNPNLNPGVAQDVCFAGGTYPYPTSGNVISISSNNTVDTNVTGSGLWTVYLEGLNSSYAPITETVLLNGTNAVLTTGNYLRLNRSWGTLAGSGGVNMGQITGTHGGNTLFVIPTGECQTQNTIYTVPVGKTAYLTNMQTEAKNASASSIGATLRIREFGSVFRVRGNIACGTGYALNKTFDVPITIPEKSDIKVRVDDVSASGTQVNVRYSLLLIDN